MSYRLRLSLHLLTVGLLMVPGSSWAAPLLRGMRVTDEDAQLVWNWSELHDDEAPIAGGNSRNTFDSPIHFYRDRSGQVFAVAANTLNYRVPFDASFGPLGPSTRLTSADRLFDSNGTQLQLAGSPSSYYHYDDTEDETAGSCAEPDYDFALWLFGGLWSGDGVNFAALAHHEYHPRYSCLEDPEPAGHFTHDWINATHHLTGWVIEDSLAMLPAAYQRYAENGGISNASRLVLIPRPWEGGLETYLEDGCYIEGTYHPSNIVRERGYFYAIVGATFINDITDTTFPCPANSWSGSTPEATGGFVMIRSANPATLAWYVHTEAGWVAVNDNTWLGFGGQEPTVFLPHAEWNVFDYPHGGQNLTYSLVRHLDTGAWIALGYQNHSHSRTLSYSITSSLANPRWHSPLRSDVPAQWSDTIAKVEDWDASNTAPVVETFNYPSIQSHVDSGYTFSFVSSAPYLYYICPAGTGLCSGETSTDGHDRDIWRMPLQIDSTAMDSPRSHLASAEFASIQGTTSGWSYRTDAGTHLAFDAANNRWKPSSGDYPLVWDTGGHPGTNSGAVRRWTAHVQGRVNIHGSAWKADTTGGDGVGVAIRQSGSYYLWQRDLAYNDGEAQGESFDLWIVLDVGEYVEFVITKGPSTTEYDSTYFDPTIEFTPHYAAADILAALAPVLQ